MVPESGDFITAVDEKSIIVVKELAPQDGSAEMDHIAEMILDSLGEEKKKNRTDRIRYRRRRDQGSFQVLQGSADGTQRRQDLSCRDVR